MKYPRPQYDRYHICPDNMQANIEKIVVHHVKTRKLMTIYMPIICWEHDLPCTLDECVWSMRLGRGYPIEPEYGVARSYWARLARKNRKWQIRSKRERDFSK